MEKCRWEGRSPFTSRWKETKPEILGPQRQEPEDQDRLMGKWVGAGHRKSTGTTESPGKGVCELEPIRQENGQL